MAKSITLTEALDESKARENWLLEWGIAQEQQAQALTLLDALGCSAQLLLNNKEQQENLKAIFKRLLWLKKLLPDSSAQTFIYHAQQLCQLHYPDNGLDVILISEKNRQLNARLLVANTTATRAYGAMTFLAIAIETGLGIPFFTFFSQVWNGVDTYECSAERDQQQAQGEQYMAKLNLLAGGQMAIATSLVTIDKISEFAGPALLGLSTVACGALLGGSFALSYFFCWAIEVYKVQLSDKEIVLLEAGLEQVEQAIKHSATDENALPALKEERVHLKEHLLIAKARRQDLQNSADAFRACAIAMTVALVVAYVALNVLTCGGVNLVPVLIAIAIFATYLYRAHYTQSLSHSALAQQSLLKPPVDNCPAIASIEATGDDRQPLLEKQSLHARLMTVLEKNTIPADNGKNKVVFFGVDFCKKVTVGEVVNYFKTSTSLVDYLQDLQFKNPAKLEKLLLCLENDDSNGFQTALAEKKQAYSLMETTGLKIFKQLTPVRGLDLVEISTGQGSFSI